MQIGVRDYSWEEVRFIHDDSRQRVVTYFDKDLKNVCFEGETWKQIVTNIVNRLPEKYTSVLISTDYIPNYVLIPVHRCLVVLKWNRSITCLKQL